MKKILLGVLFFWGVVILIPIAGMAAEKSSSIPLMSPAFEDGGSIPRKYTCDGTNVSPPLKWKQLPPQTQSIALIMEDPDTSRGIWVHWVLFDLPPMIDMLPEAIPGLRKLANGEKQGTNSFHALGYQGPCPPSGSHRYFFRIYALDAMLGLEASGMSKVEVLKAMKGHVIAEGELMGRYTRAAR